MSAPAGPPIRVEFTPRFGQYLRANFHVVYRQQRLLTWLAAGSGVLGVLCCAVAVPLLIFLPDPGGGAPTLRSVLPGLLLPSILSLMPLGSFVIQPLLMYVGGRARWRAAVELREPKAYEFTEAGVSGGGAHAAGTLRWDVLTRAETVGGLFVLTTGQRSFVYVPVGAFSPEAFRALGELVRRKLAETRRT